MPSKPVDLPEDLASAYLALLSEREVLQAERDVVVAERDRAVAQAAKAQALLSDSEALIASLELAIEKLKRELRGQRSERAARLIDQLELQLEELVMAATEDEVAAQAAARSSNGRSFVRRRPVRKPWPEDIERERVVIDPPATCACCGGSRLAKLGEDITETLEEIPRRFKVIETVREKFTCRDCEAISQPPAPFHATPRGFIGPHLLATILFDKFGMHSPLNRQSARFTCEGIALSTSTLADQVGFGTSALMPVFDLIEKHVFAAERLHGDDTTIPIRAKSKCTTGRIWGYVRDDQPFGGRAARQRSIMPRVTAAASIRRNTWPGMAAFCRVTVTVASSRSVLPNRKRCRSLLLFATRMRGGNSLNWPISRKGLGIAKETASRSPRSRWRPSSGSTRCLRSSVRSMA